MRYWLLVFGLLFSSVGYAQIDEQLAVRALIGEAIGQQDDELLAHAYALKNRGTLRGVYGLHATHTPNPTPEQWQRVSKAWWTANLSDCEEIYKFNERLSIKFQSQNCGPMGECTEWRSDYDLKKMAGRGQTPESQGLYDGLRVGETFFYKLRNNS